MVAVEIAMSKIFVTLLRELVRSTTRNQSNEMARHNEFDIETDEPNYFCDPHLSPPKDYSNEPLRQYMQKD